MPLHVEDLATNAKHTAVRCNCCLRNPMRRNQTLAAPGFLRDSRSGPRFLKIPPANQHEKCREKNETCHEIGPSGSDFDENLCGRRCFSWRIFLGGSRPDPAKSIFRIIRNFQETLRRRRDFLNSLDFLRNSDDSRIQGRFLIVSPTP